MGLSFIQTLSIRDLCPNGFWLNLGHLSPITTFQTHTFRLFSNYVDRVLIIELKYSPLPDLVLEMQSIPEKQKCKFIYKEMNLFTNHPFFATALQQPVRHFTPIAKCNSAKAAIEVTIAEICTSRSFRR